MTKAMYQSSKGAIAIDGMPLRYARNALEKLKREAPERVDEITAISAHVERQAAIADASAPRTLGDILDELPPVASQEIGANGPPATTPLEAHTADINDLYDEAHNWLDGTDIETQGQADEVTKLMNAASKAGKAADAQRAAEKKPHDDAGKAVQTAWKPLVEKADRIEKGTKAAIGKWLIKVKIEQRAIADKLAKDALDAAEAARAEHLSAANSGNLAAMEDAERTLDTAKALIADATRADRAKPAAKVEGMTRAVGLVTVWDVALSDSTDDETPPERKLAAHYWQTRRADVVEFYMTLARADVKGGTRVIPGTMITSRQVAR